MRCIQTNITTKENCKRTVLLASPQLIAPTIDTDDELLATSREHHGGHCFNHYKTGAGHHEIAKSAKPKAAHSLCSAMWGANETNETFSLQN
jgi:hypothetical protein